MTTNSVFPEGHVHWFFRCFNWLCGRKIKLEGVNDEYHNVICNCAVYTTDGRFFYGYYTPGNYSDLDEFTMMPPDFLFCCHCCCYSCCECYRLKYDTEWKREADLFFGKGKEGSKPIEEPAFVINEDPMGISVGVSKGKGKKTRRNRKK